MTSKFSKMKDWLYSENLTFLLICLIIHALADPFLENILNTRIFLNLSFTAVLISAVFSASKKKKNLLILLVVTIPCFIFIWLKPIVLSDNIVIIEVLLKILFKGVMIFLIAGHITKADDILRNTISAALIGYLLLALLWANLYFLLELLFPDSFTISHKMIISDPSIFRYFSFVTITTLGFGDIAPVSSQARSLTVLEAFIGQVYLAVLIGRLVGMQTAQFFEKKQK